MTDRISRDRRSANMAAIRGRNTAPELLVRSMVRQLGVGYRLHDGSLPGRPDIVLKGRRKVIFVHGCFWHRHQGCRYCYEPKSRIAFWRDKFAVDHLKGDATSVLDDLMVQKVLVKLKGAERHRPMLTDLLKVTDGLPRSRAFLTRLIADLDEYGSFQASR